MIARSRPDLDLACWLHALHEPVDPGAQHRLETNLAFRYCAHTGLVTHRGTAAFDVLFERMKFQPGDEVLVSTLTYSGVVDAILRAGALPVLTDTAPLHVLSPAEQLASGLTCRTRAIVISHLYGMAVDMTPILRLARDHNCWLIEDCAHAYDATLDGQLLGTFGDATILSFGFEKHLSGGLGGALLLRHPELTLCECAAGPEAPSEVEKRLVLATLLDVSITDPSHYHGNTAGATSLDLLEQQPRLTRRLLAAAKRDQHARALWAIAQPAWHRHLALHRTGEWFRTKIKASWRAWRGQPYPSLVPRHDPWRRLGASRSRLVNHEEARLQPSLVHRRHLTKVAFAGLARHVNPQLPQHHPTSQCSMLHLPLIFSDPAHAQGISKRFRQNGVEFAPLPWRLPLHAYPRFQGRIRTATPSLPHSEHVAPRLRLLPTHTDIDEALMEAMMDWLRE